MAATTNSSSKTEPGVLAGRPATDDVEVGGGGTAGAAATTIVPCMPGGGERRRETDGAI